MLVAKLFLVATFFSMSFSSEEKNYSRLSRVLRLNADRSSHVKKRHKEPEYFEQCSFVNLWREELGHVIVLAFLDPAWHYSFRQAVMLHLLSSRLRKSGFPNIRFFVITPPSDLMENKNEDDLEIKTWQEISAIYDTENLVNASEPFFKDTEMIFLQDDQRSRIWEKFRASKDQVVIIDQCGKLTYHVIVPWSILHFPYVKAAILSTYQEDPCGGCDPAIYQTLDDKDYFSSLINSTDKEAEPRRTDDANLIWTTERLENATVYRNESSEEEYRASTVSSVFYDETINDTGHLNFSSATDSPVESEAYRHNNDTTKSPFDENNSEKARNQENSMSLENIEAATIFEPQDVPPKKESYARKLINDYSDGVKRLRGNLTPATKTTSDDAGDDETQGSKGNADVNSDSLTEYGQNNLIGKSTKSKDAGPFEGNTLPLRIIMYAPHVHKSEGKMKKHVHLILKTDDSDFHGHLNSEINVMPLIDSWQGNFRVTSSEEHNWGVTKADNDNDSVNQTVFETDENPGLYGEVADYWRSYEDSDIVDRNETFNDTYDKSTISYNEEHTNVTHSDQAITFSQQSEDYLTANVTTDTNITNPQNINGLDESDSSKSISIKDQYDREEETRNKLIEHYSKLLAWIDYKLNK